MNISCIVWLIFPIICQSYDVFACNIMNHMTLFHGWLCLTLFTKESQQTEPDPSLGGVCTQDFNLISLFPSIHVLLTLSSRDLEGWAPSCTIDFNLENGNVIISYCGLIKNYINPPKQSNTAIRRRHLPTTPCIAASIRKSEFSGYW